jgi:hypothetical protein
LKIKTERSIKAKAEEKLKMEGGPQNHPRIRKRSRALA